MAIFKRNVRDIPTDWRDDAKVLAAQKRLAELDALIAETTERLVREHEGIVADLGKAVEHEELRVLAGKGSESELAAAQARHLAARRAKALDMIARSEAETEKAALEKKLPELVRVARRGASAELRRRYLAIASELKAALLAVQDADGRMVALVGDAERIFPGNDGVQEDGRQLPEATRCAGLKALGRARMDAEAHRLRHDHPGARTDEWLRDIDAAVENVSKLASDLDK